MSKKSYKTPNLIVHGTVERITLGTGDSTAEDTVFNSFTGNTFNDIGSYDTCTRRQNGQPGTFGCPAGT